MKQMIIAALFAVLVFSSCKEQKEVNPKEYLPEAKYDGMKGEIDSIIVTHYKDVEGNRSNVILLKASASYDKNGYAIENITQVFDSEGNLLENSRYEITRDNNSLPTAYSILQGNNDSKSFKLDKREDRKETYSLVCDDKKTSANNLVTKEFEGMNIRTISNFGKDVTSFIETYNEEGKRTKVIKSDKENKTLETNTIEYSEEGQLSKKTVKKESATEENFYSEYEFDESATHNWTQRIRKDANGNIKAYEERKIYYRK